MALVRRPDVFRIKRIQWEQDVPAQINRSGWTQRRQVVTLPGPALWRGSFELVPIIGEANVLKVRGFLAKLKGALNSFYLPATENAQTAHAISFLGGGGGGIVDAANTTVTGSNADTAGVSIEKTGGVNGAWDASASSSSGLTGGARLSFRFSQTNLNLMAALNSDPSTDHSYASLDHAIFCTSAGIIQIYESGANIGDFGDCRTEDIYSIVYDNSSVRYYRGGELLRSVAKAAGITYYMDSSIFNSNARLANLQFGAPQSSSTSVTLRGLPIVSTPFLKEGWMATALLYGGGAQLITITQDIYSDGSGDAPLVFLPPLRGAPFALVTGRPFAEVAPAGTRNGWSVDPGQLYGVALEVEEAF